MKICMIAPSFPDMKCGVGDYTARLLENIAPLVDKITVITIDSPKIKLTQILEGVKNVEVKPIIKRWDFFRLPFLLKEIKTLNPDVIHIQYHWRGFNDGLILKGLMIALLPVVVKFKIRPKIVLTMHSFLGPIGGPYLFRVAGHLRRFALKPLLLFSDRIIINNNFDSGKICESFPSAREKIFYIPGGAGFYDSGQLSVDDISRIRSEYGISSDEIVLSNFGYMFPYKGLEEILRAMVILRNKGHLVRFLAIGGFDIDDSFNGAYFSKLKDTVDSLGLRPYVHWAGFCDSRKTSSSLLASNMCVMPFAEGVSESRSSFMGALSLGLPIITTYSQRTPEDLIDRVNVLLVPPRDHHRLAEAIEELIHSPDLREKLSQAAKELYARRYSWSVITVKTLEVYNNIDSGMKNNAVLSLYKDIGLADKIHIGTRYKRCPFQILERYIPREGKILDFGCGHGLFSNLLALQSQDRHVIGFDPSLKKIEIARKSLDSQRRNIEFINGLFSDINKDKFSAILMIDVLYLISFDEQKEILQRCRSYLKEDGILMILEVPFENSLRFKIAYLQEIFMVRILKKTFGLKLYYRTLNEWLTFLRGLGFNIEDIRLNTQVPSSLFICRI